MSAATLFALMLSLVGARGPVMSVGAEPAGPAVTLIFPAKSQRLETGLWLARGESLSFAVEGEWTMWAGHFGRSNAIGHRYRVGLYGWGCLMARIGGGGEFSVGTGRTLTADASGALVLYPNLGAVGMTEGDGELKVTIRGGRPEGQVIAELAAKGAQVQVPAAGDGTIADLYVEAGQEVRFDAFGQWRMYADGQLLGPDGDLRRRIADGVAWGRLMVRFGGPGFGVGEWQQVGGQRVVRAKQSGLVQFRPAVGQYEGHERSGALTVVVRGAQPATPELRRRAEVAAQDYERQMAYLRLCQYRRALMLPAPATSPELMRAAQAQAEYLAGLAPTAPAAQAARERVAGFGGQFLSEASHGYTDGVRAVDGLWQTVRQRMALADPRATAVGVGVASGQTPVCVVVTGALPNKSRLPDAAVYPADNAAGVPGTWNGLEEPALVPADQPRPYGCPVSLTVPTGIDLVAAATLVDRLKQPVACSLQGPPKGGATAVLVPLAPLKEHETYTATMTVVSGGKNKVATWRFTCGLPDGEPIARPRLDDPANPKCGLER
ncbi:MAG: hypothetical protein HZB16_19050 [Armatimonadetes bacterium]|nr:hypothetical protein [Armatimonadota bacterium]